MTDEAESEVGRREGKRARLCQEKITISSIFHCKKVEQRERWGRESERKMEKKNEGTCTSEPVIPAGHEFNLVQTGFHTQTKSPKLNNEARRLSWPSKTIPVSIVIWPHRLHKKKNAFKTLSMRLSPEWCIWPYCDPPQLMVKVWIGTKMTW